MSRRTSFRRAALEDVRSARQWYEDRRLGAAFVTQLEVCIAGIERHPLSAPIVDEQSRRAHLRRFPYAVYYDLVGDDEILVLAVWHGRRAPEGWREREA